MVAQWVGGEGELLDRLAADEVLLDDAVEHFVAAVAVLDPFGVNDGDGARLADFIELRLAGEHVAMLAQAQLLEPVGEEVPRFPHAFLAGAARHGGQIKERLPLPQACPVEQIAAAGQLDMVEPGPIAGHANLLEDLPVC